MQTSLLIKGARLVNEGKEFEADVYIKDGRIAQIGANLNPVVDRKIHAQGCWLLPGVIDDQVHFREPGLTHKGDIQSESRAAVAGGITSYMEMPNTKPQSLTQELLAEKYERAAAVSAANYSFYMGASNDNLDEVLKTDPNQVCGIKVFMGSSTGNMLVDDYATLEGIFQHAPILVATHCEKEEIIRANLAKHVAAYGDDIPIALHPVIRSREACYASSSEAVALARKHNTRLHVLHISTADELALFDHDIPLAQKRITSEACIHHLWFTDEGYDQHGTRIKWNPAVKAQADRTAIRQALVEGRIDVIATDHAPHTQEEKANPYTKAPSGGPMVQHSLLAMLELVKEGVYTLPFIVDKMSHAPAICFQVAERGFIREGYWADLVLVKAVDPWQVHADQIRYKCGWSPLEGTTFHHEIYATIVSGALAYMEGKLNDAVRGRRLTFDR